jgi:hypothetical protein
MLKMGTLAFDGDHNRLLDDPPTADEELRKMDPEKREKEIQRMQLRSDRAQYFNRLRAELDKKGIPYYKPTLSAGPAGVQEVWRDEIEKVDPITGKRYFPHLKVYNYYGGGALSNTATAAEDLPTDAVRMQAKMDSFHPLDPRTADKIVLSTYPTLSARLLDIFVRIRDMDVPIKRGEYIKQRFGIGDDEYQMIQQAIKTGLVPEGLTPTWRANITPGTFGTIICDEAHKLAGLKSQIHALISKLGGQHRIFASATPSSNRVRDLRGILHLLQTVVSTSDETYDRLLASSRKIRLQSSSSDDDGADDGDGDLENHLPESWQKPTNDEYNEANKLLENRALWQLNEDERKKVRKVTDWVAFDQCTRGSGSDAHSAPTYVTPVWRALIVRRVKMTEIAVGDKTYCLMSDIPPLYMDHMEVMMTPREQQEYDNAAARYINKPDTYYQPKEKSLQGMAGQDFLAKAKVEVPNDEEVTNDEEAKQNVAKLRALQHASSVPSLNALETNKVDFTAETAAAWYVSSPIWQLGEHSKILFESSPSCQIPFFSFLIL